MGHLDKNEKNNYWAKDAHHNAVVFQKLSQSQSPTRDIQCLLVASFTVATTGVY